MQTDQRAAMLAELQETFVPALRVLGFSGSGQHFRRIRGRTLQLVAIRHERDGSGFRLELASCALERLVDDAGQPQWPGNVTAWGIAMAGLGPHVRVINPASEIGGSEFPGWRRAADGTLGRETDLRLGVPQAIAALPALESWFESVRAGGVRFRRARPARP